MLLYILPPLIYRWSAQQHVFLLVWSFGNLSYLRSLHLGNRDGGLSSDGSEYEWPPNRGGWGRGKGSVRAAVLQEKEALKKNGQCMSQ